MTISTDNASSGLGTTAVSTMSWSHTVGTSGTLLVVGVHARSTASSLVNVSSVRWGTTAGSTLTLLIARTEQIAARHVDQVSLWSLANPTVGTTLIHVDLGNSSVAQRPIGGAISLQGTSVFKTSGVSSGGATTATVTVSAATTGANDWLIGLFGAVGGTSNWTTVSSATTIAASTVSAGATIMLWRAANTSGTTSIGAAKQVALASLHVAGVAVDTTVAPAPTFFGWRTMVGVGL